MSVRYISTRGGPPPRSFSEAALAGLAEDGGLLIPNRIPDVRDRLDRWARLSYPDLAFEVIRLYADLPEDVLRRLIADGVHRFRTPEVTPVVPAGPVHILELFHGPTLAFKDVALQFIGPLFDHLLAQAGQDLNVLVATSGDTGSAAIAGLRGRDRVRIFVMHPRGRVSPIQERQMTTVLDENVFNLAVEGTFDDCQRIMKGLFADVPFKERLRLGAVNSVNWARVLCQIVYYVWSVFRVREATGAGRVQMAVPTGNFGNVLAGYYARRMGLPLDRLILATNENDILTRCFTRGDYSRGEVVPTLSPSMDIQVASNFERYLYYRLGEDPARVREAMAGFEGGGELRLLEGPADILAGRADTDEMLAAIRRYWQEHRTLLDPHTAVGVAVGERLRDPDLPLVCQATAHPAKFPDAIRKATGQDGLARHPLLDAILTGETRRYDLPGEVGAVREFLERNGSGA